TGHHRLMIWRNPPCADRAPADLIIGQPDFVSEGRNARGDVGAATLNVPTGVGVGEGTLAVADAWNHRVLLWLRLPDRSNQPADVVLGQRDFGGCLANRGAAQPDADTLNWCYGVAICGGRLYVADTGNRRVLVWHRIPQHNGAPADLVLGHGDFTTRDEGDGGLPGAVGMRWPHAVVEAKGRLFIADAGSSRIMVWNRLPRFNGAPCDAVLGQADFDRGDHNRGFYDPSAASLNMPYGMAMMRDRLIVADTANSRLVDFDCGRIETGGPAERLAGQHHFRDKGENRWERPGHEGRGRDRLCWPYGVAASDGTAIIADSGNNRVLLWDFP
ncbi:MAG TPA: hypothetical protein VL993_07635, partial [Stellaceae bacterium]|nr:hypothetical protein [Stellaceae bacterium]